VSQLFQRKPIAALVADTEGSSGMKRSLRAGDLIMLAIGAVIGAGIFGAIGTAAAGQLDAQGHVIRAGAGPALVFSFLLLGGACALAGLCYAELASMIPQAGSAYAYSYATLGELIAWIIGWDLILEYAVGNVAVAISWGDYFKTLIRGVGVELPPWLATGYRTALLSPDAPVHGLLQSAPHIFGIPILVNVPAFAIVLLITWLLLRGARESVTANNIMVIIKLLALTLFVAVGITHLKGANYHPFAPNGFTGIHQGAAIVFFAYIGFDAISTAAEETVNPQRNLPIGILGGLGICTLIYVLVGFVLTGMVPYMELGKAADPLSYALEASGFRAVGWIVALGAAVSMSAVLLVFQYGQPRIFFAMARDGLLPQWAAKLHPRTRIPWATTLLTGVFVALWSLIGDAGETYDLTNIGTLFAFILVSVGVLVLRYKEPERPRPFRVPLVWPVTILSAAGCLFIMKGLPDQAWERFGYWLVIGLHLYFSYGFSHSCCRTAQKRSESADALLMLGWTFIALFDCAGLTLSALGMSLALSSDHFGMAVFRHGVSWIGVTFWSVMLVDWMWIGWQRTIGANRSRPTPIAA
jgi:APA family basic amino acid/polyamine antiporter